ncbi:zinc-ribbon domain-containing protein [Atopobium fossor]|uniref:zinc-ribbon domain-containing protein n=1 Tax=Atopobium fossor TaxID=39487 RepID=UPI00041CD630|nr:zinc-ribbon domain-containing protein [Atopobium fossor]
MSQLQFSDKQYLTRSWRMLTREKGWIKAVLLLTLYSLIPIFGSMVVLGASFEWARLTAWGVESSPKQKGINFGKCLKTGFFATVVMMVSQAACTFVISLMTYVLPFLDDVSWIFATFVAVIIDVVVLYMTIYDQFSAAFSFANLWKMISHDFKGLCKIWGEHIKIGLIIALLSIPFLVFMFMIWFGVAAPDIAYQANILNESAVWTSSDVQFAMAMFGKMIIALLPVLIVVWIIGSFFASITGLLTANMIGLWMLQFRVSEWGNPNDPLPTPMTASDFTTPPTSPTAVSVAPAATPTNPMTPMATPQNATSANDAPAAPVVPAAPATPIMPSAAEGEPVKEVSVPEEPTISESEPKVNLEADQQPVSEPVSNEEKTTVIEKSSTEEEPAKTEPSAESLPASHGAFCPECGSKVPENGAFCPQCGTKLEE